MTGSLGVLNVGAGDIVVTFNPGDEAEKQKAIRMLKDMQTRGYGIFVQLPDNTYTRAVEIDGDRGRYVILAPADVALPADAIEEGPPLKKRGRGRPRKVSVPVSTSRAHAVARSAGG